MTKVTEAQVHAAIDGLVGVGVSAVRISSRTVRTALGENGSLSTIGKHRATREAKVTPPPTVAQLVQQEIASVLDDPAVIEKITAATNALIEQHMTAMLATLTELRTMSADMNYRLTEVETATDVTNSLRVSDKEQATRLAISQNLAKR